jgi:excisionase family DNA binding protein
MRSRIVGLFSDALAASRIPALGVAGRYRELGEALLPLINPVLGTKYGLEMTSFILENVSVPPEVEEAIDKRAGMAAVGNLNDFVKYQMAQGLTAGGSGTAALGAEMAVGLAMAQQMLQQTGGLTGPPAAPNTLPEPLTPADAARLLNVSEADVIGSLESGELKGRKIGSQWRVTRAQLAEFLQ